MQLRYNVNYNGLFLIRRTTACPCFIKINRQALIQAIAHWWSIPMQPHCVLRKYDILVLPDSHQTTQVFTSLFTEVQSLFPSIYTQTVLFAARIDIQIAVDGIQVLDVHVIDKPHRPHAVLSTRLLESLVPVGRQSVRDVGTKVRRDGWLVLVKPVLNITNNQSS